MKRKTWFLSLIIVFLVMACSPRERTVVMLSTNDIHAQIENFPQLAAAVEACRDTAQIVFLVDAGDRWTGNAYVDMANGRRPILELMNRLRFDVATIGNHEFDAGQHVLGDMMHYVDFPIICANMQSDTTVVPQPEPYVILEQGGVKVGFVGVVTNYEGENHPAGHAERFEGLRFPDPKLMAEKFASIADRCDVLVLLSHMGTSHDRVLLERETTYDVVVGGHSHEEINEVVNGTLLTQTGKGLHNIGVTTIRLRGGDVVSTEFRLVPLKGYASEGEYAAMVERYYANLDLQRHVGSLSATASIVGLANLIAELVADHADADVGFYHIGGVRMDSMSKGEVPLATLFDLEPFGATVSTMRMTPEQMRRMIVSKFNDTENTKESHRIDLYSTTPYTILTDASGDAVDVRFAKLREGQSYSVAVSDYVYKKYKDLHYTDGVPTEVLVTDLLLEEFEDDSPIEPDNVPHQTIVRR